MKLKLVLKCLRGWLSVWLSCNEKCTVKIPWLYGINLVITAWKSFLITNYTAWIYLLFTKTYPGFLIILISFSGFCSCFGGQQEAKVMNTKQGNQDHSIRSRTEGSSSRYFTVLEFFVFVFLFSFFLYALWFLSTEQKGLG